jgi:hypothetical protein
MRGAALQQNCYARFVSVETLVPAGTLCMHICARDRAPSRDMNHSCNCTSRM